MSGAAVFCYHDFVTDPAVRAAIPAAHRPYVLTEGELAAHLAALDRPAYRASRLADVVREPAAGRFVLSFDDGHVSNHRVAYPLLAARGWSGCFFIIAGQVGAADNMDWPQLRELADGGMEIGSHSLTHPFMHDLDAAGVRHEFGESKRAIEERLRQPVRTASLPRGWEPPQFEAVLRELGYRVFCTSRVGWWYPGGRALAMPR